MRTDGDAEDDNEECKELIIRRTYPLEKWRAKAKMMVTFIVCAGREAVEEAEMTYLKQNEFHVLRFIVHSKSKEKMKLLNRK